LQGRFVFSPSFVYLSENLFISVQIYWFYLVHLSITQYQWIWQHKLFLLWLLGALLVGSNASLTYLHSFLFIIYLLLICAYKAWVISSPCPHPLPYHPLHPLPLLPTPSIPSRNYFALISNFVVERV
jgi:hypothetical protein